MSFSDEDLKRLKESLDTYEDNQQQCYRVKEFKALLTRPEAAEALAEYGKKFSGSYEECQKHQSVLQSWRKAAGR